MHRSGTSCLAGALEKCGLSLGEVKRKGKYNKKGYFEKVEVQKIHDQILGMNKSSWYAPPKQIIKVHNHHIEQLESIANQLKNDAPCGLKDPRILLLLDFWKDLVGKSCQLIGTFRHPLAVAASLHHRNKIPIKEGIQLWKAYNDILVASHQKEAFPLIHYDLTNGVEYRQKIVQIASDFGLKPNKLKLRLFISRKLEHHRNSKMIPISCRDLYDYLLANAH